MLERSEFNGLLADLARTLGLGSLPVDEAGGISFMVDDRLLVSVAHDGEDGALWLTSPLGLAPAAAQGEVWRRLLAANVAEAAADRRYALDAETGVAVLQSRVVDGIDRYATLEAVLLTHIDRADAAMHLVEDDRPEPVPSQAAALAAIGGRLSAWD